MNLRVAIRADAGTGLGSGHVMRTLALAKALRARGSFVSFLMNRGDDDMREYVHQQGFSVHPLDRDRDDLEQSQDILSSLYPVDLVIVDHYGLSARWEGMARGCGARVMVIDDLADRTHVCDLLLDQNLGSEDPHRYDALLSGPARVLLGPSYALLREEFRRFAASTQHRDGSVRRVLVFMGGFDATGETQKALHALSTLTTQLDVDVVLPPEAPHSARVRETCVNRGYAYLGRVDDISSVMEAADLSIGAMGATAWERCITGLPALTITVASNQRASASACALAGAVRWLGDSADVSPQDLRNALEACLREPHELRQMSIAARSVVNASHGFTTDRVIASIEELCNA